MAFLTLKSGGGTTMNVGASTEFIRHYSIGNCLESPARGLSVRKYNELKLVYVIKLNKIFCYKTTDFISLCGEKNICIKS